MKCPNCGNQIYERLDYSIVRCTECLSLWDPYVYPGFPEPDVDIGEIWDTAPPVDKDWKHDEADEDDPDELEEEDELDGWDLDDEHDDFDDEDDDFDDEDDDFDDEDDDFDDEYDDWDDEDEDD
jgi:hypothetical protein